MHSDSPHCACSTGTMLGMGSVGLLVANPKTLVKVWNCLDRCDVADLLVWNSLASLLYHDVKGAILIGVAGLTLLDWTLNKS